MATTLPDLQDWRFTVDFEGIAWAVIDRKGESMNSLGRRPTEELGEIVKAVEEAATERRGEGPRADERQGAKLHRRRRHQGVRELRHRGQDHRGGEADARALQPHRPAAGARGRRHPRLLPRRRARARACLRLAHRRSRGGDAARLSRGEARHLPRAERHGALDPGRRPDGRHDRHADRAHAAPDARPRPSASSISWCRPATISAGPRAKRCCRSATPRARRGGSG